MRGSWWSRHEGARGAGPSFCDALDPARVSPGALSVRQPGVLHHYVPDRSGEATRLGAGAARDRSALVKYEFIRMPDSTGFGDYTESGQVIPVAFRGRKGNYTLCMFLDDHPPIAGGRELWGFPKKLGSPTLRAEADALIGTLDYGSVRVAPGPWVTCPRYGERPGRPLCTQLPPQDHPARRRQPPYLRARQVGPTVRDRYLQVTAAPARRRPASRRPADFLTRNTAFMRRALFLQGRSLSVTP